MGEPTVRSKFLTDQILKQRIYGPVHIGGLGQILPALDSGIVGAFQDLVDGMVSAADHPGDQRQPEVQKVGFAGSQQTVGPQHPQGRPGGPRGLQHSFRRHRRIHPEVRLSFLPFQVPVFIQPVGHLPLGQADPQPLIVLPSQPGLLCLLFRASGKFTGKGRGEGPSDPGRPPAKPVPFTLDLIFSALQVSGHGVGVKQIFFLFIMPHFLQKVKPNMRVRPHLVHFPLILFSNIQEKVLQRPALFDLLSCLAAVDEHPVIEHGHLFPQIAVVKDVLDILPIQEIRVLLKQHVISFHTQPCRLFPLYVIPQLPAADLPGSASTVSLQQGAFQHLPVVRRASADLFRHLPYRRQIFRLLLVQVLHPVIGSQRPAQFGQGLCGRLPHRRRVVQIGGEPVFIFLRRRLPVRMLIDDFVGFLRICVSHIFTPLFPRHGQYPLFSRSQSAMSVHIWSYRALAPPALSVRR